MHQSAFQNSPRLISLYALAAFSLSITAGPSIQYRVVDLGAAPGAEGLMQGQAINDSGQAIANSLFGNAAIVWEDGVTTELSGLPGQNGEIYAAAINNLGQIVGSSDNRPVLWNQGTPTDLGLLPGYDWCSAQSINDSGIVVGSCGIYNQFNQITGFIWEKGTMTQLSLGLNEDGFFPISLNNNGQVVGEVCGLSSQGIRGFIWQNGVVTPLSFGPTSNGDNGWIGTVGAYHDGTQSVNLRQFGMNNVFGINSKGELVGESTSFPTAVIWDNANGLRTLIDEIHPDDPIRDSILNLQEAIDINNHGQIMILNGLLKSDESYFTTHALLLTPISEEEPRSNLIPIPIFALVLFLFVTLALSLRMLQK